MKRTKQRKSNSSKSTPPARSKLADMICDTLSVFVGVEDALRPSQVDRTVVKHLGQELTTHRFRVAALPLPGDLRAFLLVLMVLKLLAGYVPDLKWGNQLADDLNYQREGIVRLLEAAAEEISGYRFALDCELPGDAPPGKLPQLVPVE
jgi:hypothetical protein